jgi:hypothetical protein
MQPTQASEADSGARLTHSPEPDRPEVSSAAWRVEAAAVSRDGVFSVRFKDGRSGEVDMRAFLESSVVQGSLFEPLRQEAYFRLMEVCDGVVQWPNGADLAPDAMYEAIGERGRWVLE